MRMHVVHWHFQNLIDSAFYIVDHCGFRNALPIRIVSYNPYNPVLSYATTTYHELRTICQKLWCILVPETCVWSILLAEKNIQAGGWMHPNVLPIAVITIIQIQDWYWTVMEKNDDRRFYAVDICRSAMVSKKARAAAACAGLGGPQPQLKWIGFWKLHGIVSTVDWCEVGFCGNARREGCAPVFVGQSSIMKHSASVRTNANTKWRGSVARHVPAVEMAVGKACVILHGHFHIVRYCQHSV